MGLIETVFKATTIIMCGFVGSIFCVQKSTGLSSSWPCFRSSRLINFDLCCASRFQFLRSSMAQGWLKVGSRLAQGWLKVGVVPFSRFVETTAKTGPAKGSPPMKVRHRNPPAC